MEGEGREETHWRLIFTSAARRSSSAIASLRAFLPDLVPALAEAPIVGTRLCLYCDTPDEHFWIARHPERPGLTVSTGGSGHGFKMAPMLGRLTADAVEGKTDGWLEKFRWRELGRDVRGEEAARFHGEGGE